MAFLRTIGIVTVGRSDYGIYLPVLRALQGRRDSRLWVFAGGMHLDPAFGMTADQIESDGFQIIERVPMTAESDSPGDTVRSMGAGLIGFGNAYQRHRPDLLVVLGDRYEMHSAGLAALPLRIPVAHIHGGELTFGAADDALRHSLTKLSHLHFPATEAYARRIFQLGEAPWRVTVSGAPSLDNLTLVTALNRQELERRVGATLEPKFLLATYHPATLADEHIAPMLEALDELNMQVIFTLPNGDAGGRSIAADLRAWVQYHPRSCLVSNLGTEAYFSMMREATAMIGNSSSGIIEAASFKLPVVNIGDRQRGRTCSGNVIHCVCESDAIEAAVREALSPEFRSSLVGLRNLYGDGKATQRIVERLLSEPLDDRLLVKEFHDLP